MLGSGFFGVVVLAEKERGTADEPTLWADNCDVTGQRLRCDDGSTQVAVKLVKPRPGEEALAMREGLVLSTIQNRASLRDCGLGGGSKCAHIPTCLDYGMCASGLVYTIIEFVPGMPLDKYLKQEGPLPPREVARVGSHICEALSVIHEAGFTYGDLKAENIIRSSTGDMGQVVCRTPLSPTSPPPSPTPHIHICILQAIYRLIDFGSTMGVSGCLFGSTYDARSAAAAHLSTATLASFVVSDVTAPELQVSAPPFATLNPKR
jgi:serine/threonine protein kinase